MDVGRAGDYHGVQEVYLAAVLPPDSEKPLLSPVAVCCDDPLLRGLAARGLERMHARNVRFEQGKECTLKPGETGFVLTADRVIPLTAGDAWSREQVTLLLLSLRREKSRSTICSRFRGQPGKSAPCCRRMPETIALPSGC